MATASRSHVPRASISRLRDNFGAIIAPFMGTFSSLVEGQPNNFRIIYETRGRLGYALQYDLKRGIELTEQWVRWANLLSENSEQRVLSR